MSQTYIPIEHRRFVQQRAMGRCEYCRVFESDSFAVYTIDHIIAEKHGGQTHPNNLAYSCLICNQYKGTDVASYDPDTGQLTPLFNPRQEDWGNHFRIAATGQVIPLTAIGRVTTRLLQWNRPERIKERQLLIQEGLFEDV